MVASLSLLAIASPVQSHKKGGQFLDWVKTEVASKGSRTRQLQQRGRLIDRESQTELTEEVKGLLQDEILTLLREDRDTERIFEFQNDACECLTVRSCT